MALTKIDDRGLKTPIDLLDTEKIRLGTGNDLEIYHDGSNSYLTNDTGILNIQGGGANIQLQAVDGESGLIVKADDAVELYYNGSKKLETTSSGATVTGQLNVTGVLKFDNSTNSGLDIRWEPSSNSLDFVDNVKAKFGTGDDLQIYHDGTESRVQASNGPLDLRTSTSHNIEILANDKYSFWGEADGMAALYLSLIHI